MSTARPEDPRNPADGRSSAPDPHLEPTCDYATEAQAAEMVKILDEYLAGIKAGQMPSKEELIARHPELASQLQACLAGLEFIHAAETPGPGRSQRLGDYRILREVGRGGMGAVYEAEQVSLGRRVALKILRFGGVSDPEAVERFQREAETIANLHHTNIVPIFNVGSERGVNYYAMQFIEGRSLAEVLAEAKQPLAPDQVAEWGLQAAEALAHAHQRGVIHRDVKPSNLLLDKEKRLWLTDFGLARRMDDVTLSLTGALLGTPRYMSPEQAIASKKRVDHRSDLFSLGATLYELVTGKPAFAGDTPHDVIQQILTGEPTPIRQLHRSVPQDLETIIMKCLAKVPAQRYSAARDLADDLRAFLDGRPIRARRAGLVERASRWLKAQQRSARLAATAAGLTLAVTVAALFGWSAYDAWRQASIKLDAERPPLVAEILDGEGQVVRVETAPMQNAVSLPAGDYRLRVSGNETLSQTFDVSLDRGSQSAYTLDLVDQMLLAPRAIEGSFDVVDFGSEQGLVLWNQKGIALTKRFQPMGWSKEFDAAQFPDPASAAGFRWPWHPPGGTYSGHGPWDTRPWVSPRAVDIDGQGAPDLIVAGRHQAWLMALGGDDGRILWFAPRGHDLAIPAPPPNVYSYDRGIESAVVGTPIFGHDVNADGTPDVIATLMDVGDKSRIRGERYQARCWVEAISGKTGETLWSYDVPPEWFELKRGEEVPYELRWFAVSGGGTMSGGRGTMRTGRHVIREISLAARSGTHGYRPAAVELIDSGGQTQVAIVAGRHYVALNAGSGKVARQATDMGVRPGKTCQLHDVDGDAARDVILLEEVGPPAFPTPAQPRLVVWSPQKQKKLWSKKLDAEWPVQPGWSLDAAQWPLVTDLNRDGKAEIVVPDGRYARGLAGGRIGSPEIPNGVVAVYAGETGQPLWTRRLVSMDQQVDHFLAGPDLDQDGWQELFVATLEGLDFRIHVDAMSGKTGQTLWTADHAPPRSNNTSRSFYLLPPQWWHCGGDGWPQLVTHIRESTSTTPESMVCTFSAGTGKLLHVGSGMSDVQPGDLDRDDAEDLLVFATKTSSARDKGGKLHAVRGFAGEPWRKLGLVGEPVEDFDGDGAIDLVHTAGDATIAAVSGRTGKLLWRERPLEAQVIQFGPARPRQPRDAIHSRPASGDLDGDGAGDLLLWSRDGMSWQKRPVFHAVSGRTGKRLWTAGEVTIQILNQVLGAETHDLDGDGKLEVVWLAAMDYGYPPRDGLSSHEHQLWLVVTSGHSGKVKWSHPLSQAYGTVPGQVMPLQVHEVKLSVPAADVNGDSIADLIVPALLPSGSLETRIVSGKDGTLLWSRPFSTEPGRQIESADWIPPAVCDLEGDCRAEVVAIEQHFETDASGQSMRPKMRMLALEGRSGRERWQWTSPAPLEYWYPPARTGKGNVMRPHVLRHGKEQRIAALMPGNDGRVVVADTKGNVQTRKADYQTSSSGLWVCDADGDGGDELVMAHGQSVHVIDAGQPDRDLWSRSLNTTGQRIIDVASRKGQPPLIAVALDASDNSVTGLDAKTGGREWACGGPILRDETGSSYLVPQQMALLDSAAKTPHVYFGYSSVARVRQAALDDESLPAEAVLAVAGQASPNLAGINQDPRWARDLPWVESDLQSRRAVAFVGWAMFFGLMLFVIPGGYLLRIVMLRRFSLRMLLLLPLVAGLMITAALLRTSLMGNEFHQLLERVWVGAVFAAPVIGIGLVAWWLATGQWRRVLVWLGITVVVSLLAAAIFLGNAHSMEREEHYRWSGWYLIWFLGAYFTSYIMIVALPIKYLAVAAWKRWGGRPKATALPQPETIVAAATKAAVES